MWWSWHNWYAIPPRHTLVFQQCKQELSIEDVGLRPLCPTRWTVQTGAIDAVLKNYSALLKALQHISETCYDDYGQKANGLNAQLEKFDTYCRMKLSHLIFSGTEQTSTFSARGTQLCPSYTELSEQVEKWAMFCWLLCLGCERCRGVHRSSRIGGHQGD